MTDQKMNHHNKKGSSTGLKVGLGLIAGAAAAAAGAMYFFGGKDGEKNKKKVMNWMDDAKHDLVAELKDIKEVSQDSYEAAAAKVMDKHKTFQEKSPEEFEKLGKALRNQWEKILSHLPEAPQLPGMMEDEDVPAKKKPAAKKK